jgi:hypothetical protein
MVLKMVQKMVLKNSSKEKNTKNTSVLQGTATMLKIKKMVPKHFCI